MHSPRTTRLSAAHLLRYATVPSVLFVVALTPLHAGDTIFVPLRWTAIEGSQAVTNPMGVGEVDTDNALWRRHERASDVTWIPGGGISFRSAVIRDVLLTSHFPVIADPYPPSAGGPGNLGDILHPSCPDPRDGTFARELKEAQAAALVAWTAAFPSARGPITLNFRAFAVPAGCSQSTNLRGVGTYSVTWPGSVTDIGVCMNPTLIDGVNDDEASVAIADYATVMGFDPNDVILAHELGHVLFLGHGNGLDDDANGLYDLFCDSAENVNALPLSVMAPGPTVSTITALQRATARAVAIEVPGMEVDPPGVLLPSDVFSSTRTDNIHDVSDPCIDLESVALSANTTASSFLLTTAVFGLINIPLPIERYLTFLDLDANAGSGGDPSILGFPTSFHGAELVTRVTVSPIDEFVDVRATVWRFEAGAFVQVSDPEIRVALNRLVEQETGVALHDSLHLQMPVALAGGHAGLLGHDVRLQVVADFQGAPGLLRTGVPRDRLPDGDPEGAVTLHLARPVYPTAFPTPAIVFPGSTFLVAVEGLFPDVMFKVFLGPNMVGSGTTDAQGRCMPAITIDPMALPGPRLVTIGNVGTALTADTTVEVRPLSEAEPPDCPDGVSIALWPPNHDYVALDLGQVSGVVDPNGLPLAFTVTSIRQDEPVSGPGSGNTTCDGRGVGTAMAEVRAERAGNGDGRVYHVRYRATNSAGLGCESTLLVTVPHSQNGAPAVDGGPLHASNSGCP